MPCCGAYNGAYYKIQRWTYDGYYSKVHQPSVFCVSANMASLLSGKVFLQIYITIKVYVNIIRLFYTRMYFKTKRQGLVPVLICENKKYILARVSLRYVIIAAYVVYVFQDRVNTLAETLYDLRQVFFRMFLPRFYVFFPVFGFFF